MKNYNNPYEAPKIPKNSLLFQELINNQDSNFLGLIATDEGWYDSNGERLALQDTVNIIPNEEDDSQNFKNALSSGKKVCLEREAEYIIERRATPSNSSVEIELDGRNACVILKGTIRPNEEFFQFENQTVKIKNLTVKRYENDKAFKPYFRFENCNVELENLILDFNNGNIINGMVFLNCPSVKLKNIICENVKDMDNTYGSTIIAVEDSNLNAHNIYFNNLAKLTEGKIGDEKGNITGLYCRYSNEESTYQHCDISNVYVNNMRNIDTNGQRAFEDTSSVYVCQKYANPKYVKTIKNVYGYNFGKRLVKLQGSHFILDNIQGEVYLPDGSDNEGMIMCSPPSAATGPNKLDGHYHISNIRAIGDIKYGVALGANYCTLENAYFNAPQKINIIGTGAVSSQAIYTSGNNINMKNIVVKDNAYALLINADEAGKDVGKHIYLDNAYFYSYNNSNGHFITSTSAIPLMEDLRFTNITVYSKTAGLYSMPDTISNIKNLFIDNITFHSTHDGVLGNEGAYYKNGAATSFIVLRNLDGATISNVHVTNNSGFRAIRLGKTCKNITFKNCIVDSDYKSYLADEQGRPIRIVKNADGTNYLELATDSSGKVLNIVRINEYGYPVDDKGNVYTYKKLDSDTNSSSIDLYYVDADGNILLEQVWAVFNLKSFINFNECEENNNITIEKCGVNYIENANKNRVKSISTEKGNNIIKSDIIKREDIAILGSSATIDIINLNPIKVGSTANRPTGLVKDILYYDTDLNKIICSDGNDSWIGI